MSEPVGEAARREWCNVGPGGTGLFWGSHGCEIGDHSLTGDRHVHRCEVTGFNDDGEPVAIETCCEFDDRTDMIRWPGSDVWKEWGPATWWQ